ncbi:MAG: glycoside hydrolase family 6 protein [Patescibacteria group bacterium]
MHGRLLAVLLLIIVAVAIDRGLALNSSLPPSVGSGGGTLSSVFLNSAATQMASVTASLGLSPLFTKTMSYPNPFNGANLYHEPTGAAYMEMQRLSTVQPGESRELSIIANEPRAVWFGGWNTNVESDVRTVVNDAVTQGTLPVLVAYAVPTFSCEEYVGKRTVVETNYLKWMSQFAAGIGANKVIVILEPDAIAGRECLSDVGGESNLMRKAIKILKTNPQTYVYIDAGHPYWNSVDRIVEKLKIAGIAEANGFSLNVSNFIGDKDVTEYGIAISKKVENKHFVIDSSRNGNGATSDFAWCNPRGRALGHVPSTTTGNTVIDAYLWIKQPGESDGTCNGGPEAGRWWQDYALELVRNRK